MYISVGDVDIVMNLNPHPVVRVGGPDEYYFVELKEFVNNDDYPKYVESHSVTTNRSIYSAEPEFKLPIEFYMDYEIVVYKFIDGFGVKDIYHHRYNDKNKLVLFNLVTDDIDECKLWVERIKLYEKKHGCKPVVKSKFEEIDKEFINFYNTFGIDYYKTYNIGRFPKTSTDFRTLDPRTNGTNLIWFGNWKKFWSYQHPRCWKDLTSQEIVDDILNLK